MGWLHLSFLRGKKLVVLGLGGLLVVWALGPQANSIESSFPASQVALRKSEYILTCRPAFR